VVRADGLYTREKMLSKAFKQWLLRREGKVDLTNFWCVSCRCCFTVTNLVNNISLSFSLFLSLSLSFSLSLSLSLLSPVALLTQQQRL
jgi:hypothetical protein